MKEYKIKWFNLAWKSCWTFILFFVAFKIIIILTNGFSRATSEESKLLWIVMMALFGFAWKTRIPYFDNFVSVYEIKNDKKDM